MDFDEWVAIHFAGDIEYADSWAYNKKHLQEAFEAGRESVIANRETYQKVRAEGVREGMEKAAVLVGQAHHGGGNVFEYLSELIREEIDNER